MNLKAGDVIIFKHRGFSLVPALIRLIQGNEFVHCSVVVYPGNESTAEVMEMHPRGAKITKFKNSIESSDDIVVLRNDSISPLLEQANSLYFLALSYSTSKYDYNRLLDLLVNHVIRYWKNFRKEPYTFIPVLTNDCDKKFICSTLISYLFSRVPKLQMVYDPSCEPDDFANDNNWKPVQK